MRLFISNVFLLLVEADFNSKIIMVVHYVHEWRGSFREDMSRRRRQDLTDRATTARPIGGRPVAAV
jgi:hypothetical protein